MSDWKDGVPAQIHSAHELAGQLPPHWVKMAPVFAPVQLHENTMEVALWSAGSTQQHLLGCVSDVVAGQ